MNLPVIYVVAGANGTGKTTATFDLVPPGIPVINSDEIAKQLKVSSRANINLQELGNREALRLTQKYLDENKTFGIETNLADVDTWKFLIGVQKNGHLLHLTFLCTDNIELINNRIKERTLRGEHFIRPDIVLERYINGLKLLQHYLNIPDQIRFIDSSDQNRLIAEM